ncbi:host attachment protein [Alcanivorax sp. JB21]|uniref:host attachment protein n=1 Tax=Alcanivorax limicola TaxID=2874102 RepID=UPI001CBE522C|nr:host attachment protein [Alcanivorax limicola]MBZ2189637.1 host attachment protein [Alcanivorax limicola]
MDKTWIVVAESSRARIFSALNRVQPPQEIESFAFPESRLKDQDIYSDRPGRTFESANESRSAMEPPDVRDQQHHTFARTITEALEKGRIKGKFDKLVIISPPAFLGALRHTLNGHLGKMVDKTIQKNLAGEDVETIRRYVFD